MKEQYQLVEIQHCRRFGEIALVLPRPWPTPYTQKLHDLTYKKYAPRLLARNHEFEELHLLPSVT